MPTKRITMRFSTDYNLVDSTKELVNFDHLSFKTSTKELTNQKNQYL